MKAKSRKIREPHTKNDGLPKSYRCIVDQFGDSASVLDRVSGMISSESVFVSEMRPGLRPKPVHDRGRRRDDRRRRRKRSLYFHAGRAAGES
ncbi:hypothetical protein EVAR_59743_1 [Eumeta japonica]|uniref:Uncharacterized protein n=1 Tax=Eumeta variegata TaxID=151549 RepID=A0A4C1Z0I5_EUMVA|nr:hypothetical protein EVAR_59743_1 [Eumeta japonica]